MKKQKLIFIILIAFLTGCIVVWWISSIDNLLGKEIGSDYVGEDAGFTNMTLFENGICKREYGGIFGTTDTKYYGYCIRNGRVEIQTKENIHNLKLMEIIIDRRYYPLITEDENKNP